ncbi:MAG: MerR family transcriptional regulator, partial [Actinobacteria bacterium]|nr:MerR family transcriptional regulator [Actinomycetota bacterium]
MSDEPVWTVGELAVASGLSVRVLRHWDALGLVSPERTPSGHRRYGPAHVTRLYRALALRRTGLGLRQIGALLAHEDPDPA